MNIRVGEEIPSGRTFSILVEYGKYCCLVLLSCISLRSIAKRVPLRQLSLRSIPSRFIVILDRVKVRIGQMDRHDGLRTNHTCRLRTKYLSTYVVRVNAHKWSCKDLVKILQRDYVNNTVSSHSRENTRKYK